jgi:hypothetical protein
MNIRFFFLVFVIGIASCATLDRSELKNLNNISFEPLQVQPGLEPNGLRIDIIRQTTQIYISDYTRHISTDPYHPLGFDLGNGIFFDLNYNLSLRLDYLLDFSGEEDFIIEETNPRIPNRQPIVHTLETDSLFKSDSDKKKREYIFNKTGDTDSLSFMKNDRQLHGVVNNESGVSYYRNSKRELQIKPANTNQYEVEKKRRTETYQLIDGVVYLRNLYSIHLVDENRIIEIRETGKNRSRKIFTIERSGDKIFVYGRKFSGKKISIENGVVRVFLDQKPEKEFQLVTESAEIK